MDFSLPTLQILEKPLVSLTLLESYYLPKIKFEARINIHILTIIGYDLLCCILQEHTKYSSLQYLLSSNKKETEKILKGYDARLYTARLVICTYASYLYYTTYTHF